MYFSKILVTTDFSEASYVAFDLAAYEAKMEAAEIRLINVHQYYYPVFATPDIPVPPPGGEIYERMRRESCDKLQQLADRYFHGQPVITDVIHSQASPAEIICSYAKQHGSGAIIMASRGHTMLKMLFMGSTVQRVLLQSEVPVVVVPVRRAETEGI